LGFAGSALRLIQWGECSVMRFRLKNTHSKQLIIAILLVATSTSCGSGLHGNPFTGTTGTSQEPALDVSSPANHSTVGTTVNYAASAVTTCARGVAGMEILTAPGVVVYKVNGATLNTNLNLNPGIYNTTVQAWDNCGSSASRPVTMTVSPAPPGPGASGGSTPGMSFTSLQQQGGPDTSFYHRLT
jgi:hypothetical protein